MQAITAIGLDISKSVFQVHGVQADGQPAIRQLKRRQVLPFFEKLAIRGSVPSLRSRCHDRNRGRGGSLARPYSRIGASDIRTQPDNKVPPPLDPKSFSILEGGRFLYGQDS
jgi:hypothetical protein